MSTKTQADDKWLYEKKEMSVKFPARFDILHRIVRCLDCPDIIGRADNDRMSIHTSLSTLGNQTKDMIVQLCAKGLTLDQVCEQLKMVFGNAIISNRRDLYQRSHSDMG